MAMNDSDYPYATELDIPMEEDQPHEQNDPVSRRNSTHNRDSTQGNVTFPSRGADIGMACNAVRMNFLSSP